MIHGPPPSVGFALALVGRVVVVRAAVVSIA